MPYSKNNKRLMDKAVASVTRKPRVPRPRVKSTPGRDSCVVQSRISAISPTVVYPTGCHFINPALYGGNGDPGGAVLRNYQFYIMDNAVMTYTPTCGSTTSGQLWMGYYDNPEIIFACISGTYNTAALTALAQTSTHCVGTPVWQGAQLRIPMTKRRPKYSIDRTQANSLSDADRAYHGVIIVVTTGTPTTEGLGFGTCTLEYTATGYEIQNAAITTI